MYQRRQREILVAPAIAPGSELYRGHGRVPGEAGTRDRYPPAVIHGPALPVDVRNAGGPPSESSSASITGTGRPGRRVCHVATSAQQRHGGGGHSVDPSLTSSDHSAAGSFRSRRSPGCPDRRGEPLQFPGDWFVRSCCDRLVELQRGQWAVLERKLGPVPLPQAHDLGIPEQRDRSRARDERANPHGRRLARSGRAGRQALATG
jgi:hypothetical protein